MYSKGEAYLTGAATIDFFSFMFCIPISDHVMVPQRTVFFQMSFYACASACISMHNL